MSSVPEVMVSAPVLVRALPKVQVPPTPLTVIGLASVTPFVVSVKPVVVALRVIAPVALQVVPELSDKLPAREMVPVEENVQPVTLTVNPAQASAPVSVTVPGVPERLSKVTVSAVVGTDAPLAPPEEADQFVVEDVFHVPAPPTQKRAAMLTPPLHQQGGSEQ